MEQKINECKTEHADGMLRFCKPLGVLSFLAEREEGILCS